MKKMKHALCILVTVLLLGTCLFPFDLSASAATTYRMSRTKTTLYVGDSEQLALLPASAKVTKKIVWRSSKASVVPVKKGRITAKKAGKATITAKLFGKTYRCLVTVKSAKVTYIEVPASDEAQTGNQIYQQDVTHQMTSASYWCRKCKDADKVLLTGKEIVAQNAANYQAGNSMTDLKNMDIAYDSEKTRAALSTELMTDVRVDRIGNRTTIYRNGIALDTTAMDTWFAEMKRNIEGATVSTTDTRKYGICTMRADLFMAPTNDLVGWSETDADSEFINSSLNVNEPVLINLITADKKYYHVTCNNCSGWVEADHFAICDTKESWLAQWDLTNDNVLVVTGSHVTLNKSNLAPATSGIDLYLGTQLPLVSKNDIPEQIAERYPWYSYTVYLPTRDANGKLKREFALISSHQDVHIGYPKLTVNNILTLAFSCLGDRYGWGGMLGAMDCSLYTRNIYRCFGLEIPRNTNWQANMSAYRKDLSQLDAKQKAAFIKTLTPGALIQFPGHITMYLGTVNGKSYVISDLGSLAESTGDLNIKSVYSVSINSLDVRRRSGKTWLEEATWAICPFIPASR
ncbi:MAG: hypothetical protein E7277_07685 [Lachnospiraceae bacterium]|nr:hypothetical protein [Lachnospiraceae bacterium]